ANLKSDRVQLLSACISLAGLKTASSTRDRNSRPDPRRSHDVTSNTRTSSISKRNSRHPRMTATIAAVAPALTAVLLKDAQQGNGLMDITLHASTLLGGFRTI
ncbi:unnamed protein product, partial [Mycena citricolor]